MKLLSEMLSLPLLYLVLPPCFIGFQLMEVGRFSELLIALLALSLMTVWGSMLNHYADWEADEINHKRSLLHCSFTRSDLLRYQLIPLFGFLLTILIGMRDHPELQVYFGIGLFCAFQYSFGARIKDRLILNYLYLPIAYGAFPFFAGLRIGSNREQLTLTTTSIFTLLFFLLLDLGIVPSKDFEDCVGDRQKGKSTFPNVFGENFTLRFQTIILLLAAALAMGLILTNSAYLLGLPFILSLVAVYIVQKRRRATGLDLQFHHDLALMSFVIRMSLALFWMIRPT